MIDDYFTYTKDMKSIEEWMPSMDREMQFWINRRSIQNGDIKGMFVYEVQFDPSGKIFKIDGYGLPSPGELPFWLQVGNAVEKC